MQWCSSLGSWMPMNPSADKWWRSSCSSSSSRSFSHSWTWLSTLFLQHLEELYMNRMDPPPPFEQAALEFVIFNHLRWQLDGVDAPDSQQGQLAKQSRFCQICGALVCFSLQNLSSAWSQWFQRDNRHATLYAESWAFFPNWIMVRSYLRCLFCSVLCFRGLFLLFTDSAEGPYLFLKKKKLPPSLSVNHSSTSPSFGKIISHSIRGNLEGSICSKVTIDVCELL